MTEPDSTTGLAAEYLGNYGTARGELDVTGLVNNPEANGLCRVAVRDELEERTGASMAADTGKPTLRAVDSTVHCHAEMRAGDVVLTVCREPLGHELPHVDGCTRWGHDDRLRPRSSSSPPL